MFLGVPRKPLRSVVDRTDFPSVLLVGRKAPAQLNAAESITTGPHSEVSELLERWAYTPNLPSLRKGMPNRWYIGHHQGRGGKVDPT